MGDFNTFPVWEIACGAAVAILVMAAFQRAWVVVALAAIAVICATYGFFAATPPGLGGPLGEVIDEFALIWALAVVMLSWTAGGIIGTVVALALALLTRPGRPLSQAPSATLILGLGACVALSFTPVLFASFLRSVPGTTCGTSHVDVQLAQTTLRLSPQLDLWVSLPPGPDGHEERYRYSTAPDALGSIRGTCRQLRDDPRIQSVSTGVFWREPDAWESCDTANPARHCAQVPPGRLNGIIAITLLDPATSDVSPATRRGLRRYDRPAFNETIETGGTDSDGYACRSTIFDIQCLIWSTTPEGIHVEIETPPTPSSAETLPGPLPPAEDLVAEARAALQWVRATWILSPESP